MPRRKRLDAPAQRQEKHAAFDLLDAISSSGDLIIDCASLHVIVAATHCFDLSLMDTVIVQNVNPVEKVKRSSLAMAVVIHDQNENELCTQKMGG